MNKTPLLAIKHLRAGYDEEILHDVSLEVSPGEIVCVIGESGSGKSTLLSAAARSPDSAKVSAGKVIFKGLDLLTLQGEALRNIRGAGIGVVEQDPSASLNPIRRISAQFYEAMRAHETVTRQYTDSVALKMLTLLEVPSPARILDSYPFQLSGGICQRVVLALTIALKPVALLADEPTSALDVIVQRQIVDKLCELRDKFGVCILLVTHNISVVNQCADTIAVMYAGRIVEYGHRDAVLNAPTHPYTRALFASVPRLAGGPPRGIPGKRDDGRFNSTGCAFSGRCKYAADNCSTKALEPIPLVGDHWTLCAAGAGCEN